MSEAAAHADHSDKSYWTKAFWLTGLTIVEVGVAVWLHDKEGMMGLKLGLLGALAFWKAGIVLQSFMHLKDEGKALKLMLLFPVFLICFLVSMLCLDSVVLGYAAG